MSKIGLAIILILSAGRNYAQQNYFVLIQADNNQPFYARMEGKLFSSSAQGHLILSQLKEGSYNITIGIPGQNFSEQHFSFSLTKKDLEFQLKDLGGKGWGLFNPQTLELKMPDEIKEDLPKNHLEGVKKDDAFSRLMAGVVSDTAVMYNTYAMEATLKDSPAVSKSAPAGMKSFTQQSDSAKRKEELGALVPVPGKDTSVVVAAMSSPGAVGMPKEAVRTDTSSVSARMDTAKAFASPVRGAAGGITDIARLVPPGKSVPADSMSSGPSVPQKKGDSMAMGRLTRKTDSSPGGGGNAKLGPVIKLSERMTTKGVRLVYADLGKGRKTDTIVIIIPVDTGVGVVQRLSDTNSSVASPPGSGAPADVPAQKTAVILPDRPDSSQKRATARQDSSQKKSQPRSLFINSDCRNFATDYDVDKLRVKMLEIGKDEDRILAAHKVFKTKCFATRQIRALSEVFTSDARKFRFFEAAYPFVSDEHFKELSHLLTDPVYVTKFRTMTGQ